MCTLFGGYYLTILGYTTVAAMIFTPMSALSGMSLIIPREVSSMVFGLLGRRLMAATEATVAKVSMLLAPDGFFKHERDMEEAMLALRDLDIIIREV